MDNTTSRTWAEIDLSAIRHNYQEVRSYTGGAEIMCVVKADAYGHGAVPVAATLEELGCKYLAVASIDEALSLRRGGIAAPVLIMGYTMPERAPELIDHGITQAVFDLDTALELSSRAAGAGKRIRVHLKLDTGMGRLGFTSEQDGGAAEAIALPGLEFEGVYTHFAAADVADDPFIGVQLREFTDRVEALRENTGVIFNIWHCANSGAVLNYNRSHMGFVRPGLALYGYNPGGEGGMLTLKPAMTLKTRVAQVKELPDGSTVSYGRTFEAKGRITVAVVPIGYADGLSRSLSGKTHMLVRGRPVRQVGRICMDMCMLDVTGIPGVREGDVVTVFGPGGDGAFDAAELARLSGTIPYEVLCAVSARVPRVYVSTDGLPAYNDTGSGSPAK